MYAQDHDIINCLSYSRRDFLNNRAFVLKIVALNIKEVLFALNIYDVCVFKQNYRNGRILIVLFQTENFKISYILYEFHIVLDTYSLCFKYRFCFLYVILRKMNN